MSNSLETPTLSPHLLEVLRCPVAVKSATDRSGDPGRLRLVANCWLICDESGMKYPIHNGIPIMLIEEGEKWLHTSESDLPIPPPMQ